MEESELKPKEVVAILQACKDLGIARLTYRGLDVVFDKSEESASPIGGVTYPDTFNQDAEEVSRLAVVDGADQNYLDDDLSLIEDPVSFEQKQLGIGED